MVLSTGMYGAAYKGCSETDSSDFIVLARNIRGRC